MPATNPEANTIEVSVDAVLSEEGNLTASVVRADHGQPAHMERGNHSDCSPEEYRSRYSRLLAERAKGVTISSLEAQDFFDQSKFKVRVAFVSQGYARLMQRRLLVFTPSVVVPSAPVLLQNERSAPIVLRAGIYRAQVRVKLPNGFGIDELPETLKAESSFGSFSLTFRQGPGEVTMQEELRTEAVTLAAERFPEVKKFFDTFLGADNQNAVLVKN